MSTTHTAGWRSYAKFLVALIPAALAGLKVLSDALGDGAVSSQEWIAVLVAALGALAVLAVPNKGYVNTPPVPEGVGGHVLVDPDERGVQPLDEPKPRGENFPTIARPRDGESGTSGNSWT